MQTKFNIGDKVKILDGSKLHNYVGGWTNYMHNLVGKAVTIENIKITSYGIGYSVKEIRYDFDERGLELAGPDCELLVTENEELQRGTSLDDLIRFLLEE